MRAYLIFGISEMAKKLSKEIQAGMKDDSFKILENIWGDTPKIWNSDLRAIKDLELLLITSQE